MSSKTPDKPTETVAVTEALADDVAAESLTFEPGTPALLSHLQMPRVRRAKAYGALGEVQVQNNKTAPDTEGDADNPAPVDPAEYGERYLILGLIEEYLAVCAVDEAAFREWALSVDDAALIKTFNVYMKVNQPGEATSSAS
jgi:hypothetical protein